MARCFPHPVCNGWKWISFSFGWLFKTYRRPFPPPHISSEAVLNLDSHQTLGYVLNHTFKDAGLYFTFTHVACYLLMCLYVKLSLTLYLYSSSFFQIPGITNQLPRRKCQYRGFVVEILSFAFTTI